MNIQLQLGEHLKRIPSLPFLFVGSGLSMRYLNLETWENLLRKFTKVAHCEYGYLASKADGNLPRVATLLADELFERWWKRAEFKSSREAWEKDVIKRDSPLKIEISAHIKGKRVDTDDSAIMEEVEALRHANIDGIITTNWDTFLEWVFPTFTVYNGQDSLLFSNPQSIAEIYKIHGCCTSPNSLVLTEDDYADFNARNPYLAAKLLTVFVEHPVIFLGYSISDPNVVAILDQIASCLRTENLQRLKDRLIFVQRAAGGPEEFTSAVIALKGKQLPVTLVKTDDFHSVYTALQSNRRRFPAKVLRQLKEHIYELVRTNDPTERIHVTGLEDEADSSKIEVVYGVGVAAKLGTVGYRRITKEEVLKDVVFDTGCFDPRELVLHTLPDLLRSRAYAPVFKYLRAAGLLNDAVSTMGVVPEPVKRAVRDAPNRLLTTPLIVKQAKVRSFSCGVSALATHYDVRHLVDYIPLLDRVAIDVTELHQFLITNFETLFADHGTRSSVARLVCLYDYLKFTQPLIESPSAAPIAVNVDVKPLSAVKV